MNNILTQTNFSADWWDHFLTDTNNLKKTNVFHDCMPHNETEEMRSSVMEIINLIIKNKLPDYGFRLFIEGKTLTPKELDAFFEKSIPKERETFEEWSNRCFKDKKYGIIINRGEKFSPVLVEKIAHKIKPLMNEVGVPRLGVTFTIFIGNYGWTPLGIHTDGIGENVMHFHLGKGDKTMYTWDVDVYEKIVEPERRFNNVRIEEILDEANVFDFKEGDLYFMPYGEYHVGKSDELSIGLTLWFNNHTKSALSKKIIDIFLLNNMQENGDILAMDKSQYDNLDNFEDIIDLFNDKARDSNFINLLKETYRDYKLALYSNCGFWEPPFPKAKKIDHTKSFTFKTISPFKIFYYQDDQLHLFIRGKKINIMNNNSIISFINKLNSGTMLDKKEAYKILDENWEDSVKEYLLNLLYENHILEVSYD